MRETKMLKRAAAVIVAGLMINAAGAAVPATASPLDRFGTGSAESASERGESASEALTDEGGVPVEELPVVDAAPGTVLASEPAPETSDGGSGGGSSRGSSGSGSSGREPVDFTSRIMRFATADGAGRGREVGGVVVVPDVPWQHEGPRPTVVVAPGTVGQADKCAPSATFGEPGGGQIGQVEPLLEQGFRVVVSDYIGLGAPGVHTYANRLDQGQTLLDAARAGLAIDGLPADSPIAFWGYSQGGGATASAAELASTYAPELNVVVTFAGAPPADLSQVLTRIDGSSIMGAIGYAVNGFLESNPDLRPLMDEIASPYGKRVISELSGDCIGDSMERVGLHRTNSWTVDGRSLSDHFAEHPEIMRVLDHHRIGRLKPNAPVLVLNGRHDDVIPFGQAEQLARDWCAQGADVTFVAAEIPRFAPGLGIGHAAPMMSGSELATHYLAAAFGVALKEAWTSTPGGIELPATCQF
ncbi:lipase family protein [Corynebacterium hansenii]|uniref:Lipase family protein n=1 Tax=Corynebacterium hansenii TaxID=394964 RepID=A0ABV7ZU11_9CORY|nr:lipase family protein [Corynebacterium hansenii]